MWAFLLLGFTQNADAQDKGYTLETAPWSHQAYEVCSTPNDDELRAVVFEPEIENWTYTESNTPKTKLEIQKNGIKEVLVNSERTLPAYFLKEQKIGYIDKANNWVNKNGVKITKLGQLEIQQGKRDQPIPKGSLEKLIYEANFELEYSAAMEKLHDELPCTVFSVGHYHILETETYFDFGENNPYECDPIEGLKRSQKLNYSKKFTRPVVGFSDGSNYFVKFPDSTIKTYRAYYPVWDVLYKKDGSPVCEWNDLGSLIGYELIAPTQ